MERWMSYLIAIGGIVGMMLIWSLVQAGWRKMFAVGSTNDVLSLRGGCSACSSKGYCSKDDSEKCETK
ncbi:MAG: hypothetical protein H6696_02020 [Deferribacteres bacterium]|nr:hypothetical protein [candidate division KSB1 bacterium]MCB9500689.1 hypothetical protein [Deferribacteres bacterium]